MVMIGVDPHKSSHTASALDTGTHAMLKTRRIATALTEYRQLLAWSKQFPDRRWAVENARGLGPTPGAVAGRSRRDCGRRAGHRDRPSATALARWTPQE
jgi:hypothetical protein